MTECYSSAYNKYTSIRVFCYNIIKYLINNNEEIWKLLKYNTTDALSKENLTTKEKSSLIYKGNNDSKNFRVFRSPFIDDAFVEECSQIRVYVTTISPNNRSVGTVDIAIECIVHNKLINIDNYENRLEVLVQQVISTLNGVNINGIGLMFFDKNGSLYDLARMNLYNNRNYYGFTIVMSTKAADINDRF